MFTVNPFFELSKIIPELIVQGFVVFMIILVFIGTIYDMYEKQNAKYFFRNWKKSSSNKKRNLNSSELFSIVLKTITVDVFSAAEFCSFKRRLAHLLTFYGFLLYIISTTILVFSFSSQIAPPSILIISWYLGAFLISLGCFWFWFFIRVDVSAEGNSPFRIVQADIFVLSLAISSSFAIVWALTQTHYPVWSNIFLAVYLISTVILFGTIPWSKFAHMFYKPGAALQKRVSDADGSRRNLPEPADKPSIYGSNKRLPRNY